MAEIPPINANIIAMSNKLEIKDDITSKTNKNPKVIIPTKPVTFLNTFPFKITIHIKILANSDKKKPGKVPGV